MTNHDWSNLGKDIRNLVQSAVDTKDFRKLNDTINQTINRTVNSAIEGVSQGLTQAGERLSAADRKRKDFTGGKKETVPATPYRRSGLFRSTTGLTVGGLALSASGYTLAGGLGISMLILLMVGVLGDFLVPLKVAAAFLPFTVAGGVMGSIGTKLLRRAKRFQAYIGNFRSRPYCSIRELAGSVGKTEDYVRRDVKDMIGRRMFLEGHLDKKETCLMVSNEAYDLYLAAQAQLEERQRMEIESRKEEQLLPEEARKVIEEGEAYIQKIRTCRDAISGEEISKKVLCIEQIVQKIFQKVEEEPQLVEELHKFRGYYLPTTVKLLEAYSDLAAQPVQSGNILSARQEIEGTLDTINQAFENLLDSFDQDKAWDISSDISVLQTMLAQEGLTGTDFSANRNKEAENRR